MGQITFHPSGHARLLLVAVTNTMTKSNVGGNRFIFLTLPGHGPLKKVGVRAEAETMEEHCLLAHL